ncbi:BMQ_0737 family morphogenetic spore coat protein [Alkalihalobacterium elongatum]|uniref:hypothetical protein n=1 Tax=Alkalihalobacterium elongatum TaxID=2675466 RepID=UPI001C1FD219|nr:hypothetical protein [Alkalihalobacterium elongatum]
MKIRPIQEDLCISVKKVYDWVTRQIEVSRNYVGNDGLNQLNFECNDVTGSAANPCFFGNRATCFLSDSNGNRLDFTDPKAIICEEIGERQDVPVSLPSGQTIMLQRVRIIARGFFVVEIRDNLNRVVCVSDPQQFTSRPQQFILCAPEGTRVVCHLSTFSCNAILRCDNSSFESLFVTIDFCLNVQMEAPVKIRIRAEFCEPREEIAVTCPAVSPPPQCPTVFPNS